MFSGEQILWDTFIRPVTLYVDLFTVGIERDHGLVNYQPADPFPTQNSGILQSSLTIDTPMEFSTSTGIWESSQHCGIAGLAYRCLFPEECW